MSAGPDALAAVRDGERLDVAAVDAWIAAHVGGVTGPPKVRQFSGGASNWTYCLSYPERDLVLRRPPAGTKAKSAHDMGREVAFQSALRPHFPVVPLIFGHCTDATVIGAEFYVMERVEGVIPRARLPDGLRLSVDETRALCTNVLDKLVELHAVDAGAAGLARFGRGSGYARRQVEGWSDRYERSRTWNVSAARYVRDWLVERAPEDVATCVIHNDFRFDNVVLDAAAPTRVIGVLDWEMATLGDPLMDLGGSLAYWVEAADDRLMRATRRQPTHLPGMLTRVEVVAYYQERSGRRVDDFAFYEVFGLFRLAVIAQQIYFRYHRRESRNPAFRHWWVLVNYLVWRCRGRIRAAERRGVLRRTTEHLTR